MSKNLRMKLRRKVVPRVNIHLEGQTALLKSLPKRAEARMIRKDHQVEVRISPGRAFYSGAKSQNPNARHVPFKQAQNLFQFVRF